MTKTHPTRTPAADVLTDLVLATFRLNGGFLDAAEAMARPVGLTAAWWQVLGAVLAQPAPVATIARLTGVTRQSVQRIADLLVASGLAQYTPNPHHKRAHLLEPTYAGRDAVARLADAQDQWANQIASRVNEGDLRHALHTVNQLVESLTTLSTA